MPPSSGGRRLYSEGEIAQLLKRANELQDLSPRAATGAGLTLEEVEEIARETGIDPAFIRAAATDLVRAPEKSRGFHILGGPAFLEAERVIDAPLTDETWAAIAAEVSRSYRETGKSEAVGSTREWTHGGSRNLREIRVSATPSRGHTRIRITEEYSREALLLFLMPTYMFSIFVGVMLGQVANLGPSFAIPGIFAAAISMFFALRLVFSARVRGRERRHEQLLSRIDQILGDASVDSDPLPTGAGLLDPVASAASAHDVVQTPARERRVVLPDEDEESGESGSTRERTR